MRQQWLVFLPMTLATAGLAACASMLGGEEVKVRPVDTLAAMGAPQRDTLYESAVAAINERDYARALDYLQAAKTKDPRNVKALNALGVVYDKLGRFDLSARYYAQARVLEPDSKIVAENMGYSRVLQRLLNPNQPIAVATIDLPPDLIKPASSAAPSPAMDKIAAAVPMAERKVIDTTPHVETAMPFSLPDASRSFASIILPQPVIEKRVIDAAPPAPAAAQFALPDSGPLFASVIPSEPVVMERKVIDAPRPTAMTMPLALSREKPFFTTAILPEPVLPVTEKRVVDAGPRALAPFVLPDMTPQFTASLASALQPAARSVAENAAPAGSPASALTVPGVAPEKLVIASAASAPVRVDSKPVSAPHLVMAPASAADLMPAASLFFTAETVTEKKTVAAPVPRAVALPAAPLPARPVIVASASPISVAARPAEPRKAAPAVPAVAAPSPAKAGAPISAAERSGKKTAALPAVAAAPRLAKIIPPVHPVTVKHLAAPARAATVTASFKPRAAVPAPAMKQAASTMAVTAKTTAGGGNKSGRILIGQPIRFFNASGKAGGAGTVLRRLTTLGWTMRPSEGRVQPATVLYYSAQNIAAAKALQRTLPFPVRLMADKAGNSGMRLMIGRDYLSWKPRNAHLAALWQKGATVASWQKPSIRGVR